MTKMMPLPDAISPAEKRALLARLLQKSVSSGTRPFELVSEDDRVRIPVEVEDAYPVTKLQLGMLYHGEYAAESAIYHDIFSLAVQAPFDQEALHEAVRQLLDRHPVLRTSFDLAIFSEPLQLVQRKVPVPLEFEDLRHLSPAAQRDVLTAWMEAEKRQKFDWQRAPLLRFHVHRLTEKEFQLSWTEHHAILDGWSAATMSIELFQIYFWLLGLGEPPAAPPVATLRDYVALEREALRTERSAEYWREKLQDVPRTTLARWPNLPENREQDRTVRSHVTRVPTEVAEGLKSLSRSLSVPLKSLLLAAHVKALSVLSGESDVITGLVNNGRSEGADGERVLGLFLNSMPFRIQLQEGTWRDLVLQIHQVEQEMFPHRRYPMAMLQEELGGRPLFETLFTYLNFHVLKSIHQQDSMRLLDTRTHIETSYDLTVFFSVDPATSQLILRLDHDMGSFPERQMEAISACYMRILEEVTSAPHRRHETCSLMPAWECQQVLFDWNHFDAEYLLQTCLHHLFEAQAEKRGDAVAVKWDGEPWSYRRLDRRANQIANHLQKLGVGPEILVGICMERSPELIAALLGVLKAGGAYLPLDRHYPKDRLAFLLNDSQAPVLIAEEALLERLPEYQGRMVCLDRDREAIDRESTESPQSLVGSNNLAYVIYTSGSTGKPKGVLVTHANVVRLFEATRPWFHFDERDVWTLFHSYAFDFSVWEIWGPFLYGGCLVVVSYSTSRSPDLLYELLGREGVTVLNQTPSAFLQLVRAEQDLGSRAAGLNLRLVVFGGEALDFPSLRPWFDRHGDQSPRLVNMYGITETTVHVTYRPLEHGDLGGASGSRIGIPIPDLHTHVLDRYFVLAPIGVPGELFVGGAGLARGYLNRPDLTAERFIPDPFSGRPGARLYRTGDLARWLPEGDLEYLGRIDHQVKIRGFRIELGEIEATLRQHPAIADAAVLAWGGEDRDLQLVGYVGCNLSHAQLQTAPELARSSTEQVSQWRAVFDNVYRQNPGTGDPAFNLAGWNSSYTGEPIPVEEMGTWLDSTVERILALRPRRALEIGCGTGMLLLRIAPHCTDYWGTDFSVKALDQLGQEVTDRSLASVRLLQKPADDFDGIPPGAFDGIILNSVVQYFPGIDYLVRVIEGALKVVARQGFIFLGDLRSLPLLEAFHTSVALHRATGVLAIEQLRQQTQHRLQEEEELVIDPALFAALRRVFPQISHVQVLLKRGGHHNELTKFRYDVILRVADEVREDECAWLDWEQADLDLEAVRRLLEKGSPEVLAIRGVPNARLRSEAEARDLLGRLDAPRTVRELRDRLQEGGPRKDVDPEILWSLERETPYRAEISPSRFDPVRFDVLFRRETSREARVSRPAAPEAPGAAQSWNAYANNPMQKKLASTLVPVLRSFLQERLPDYMVPARIMVLDSLPLTHHGKVDRKSLPAPDQSRPELAAEYVAPRTPVEELLAGIWAEALQVQRVGALDNFFELGGQSLIAVQVISRIRERFGIDLPLRTLFSSPTLGDLSQQISVKQAEQIESDGLAQMLEEIEAISDAEAQTILQEELGRKDP